jgi:Zinc finger SWIM domain-containing protein 1/3, RNaseH-like domain
VNALVAWFQQQAGASFSIRVDESNTCDAIFFMSQEMRAAFCRNGQFVVMYATCKTNRFGMQLVLLVGSNQIHGTATFAVGLLARANTESYTWLVNEVKKGVGTRAGSHTSTILSACVSTFSSTVTLTNCIDLTVYFHVHFHIYVSIHSDVSFIIYRIVYIYIYVRIYSDIHFRYPLCCVFLCRLYHRLVSVQASTAPLNAWSVDDLLDSPESGWLVTLRHDRVQLCGTAEQQHSGAAAAERLHGRTHLAHCVRVGRAEATCSNHHFAGQFLLPCRHIMGREPSTLARAGFPASTVSCEMEVGPASGSGSQR